MTALLMLDIDGVLMLADEAGVARISPVAVSLLNEVIERTGAEVAIISDRRNTTAPVELFQMLRDAGLKACALTICKPAVSFAEAAADMIHTADPDVFVIVDDDASRYEGAVALHRGVEVPLSMVVVQPANRFGLLPNSMPELCDKLFTPRFCEPAVLVESADEDL